MTEGAPKKSLKRRVVDTLHLLISHHEPPYMNRCWHITYREHTLHICARCSALLIGIISALFIHLFIFPILVNPITFFGAFLLSLPAVIDWSTQTLGIRESENPMRALTGFLLGYAVGFVLASYNIVYYLLVVILYSGYTLIFGAFAPRIIQWLQQRRQLEEKIPITFSPHPTSPRNRNSTRDEEEAL
jgi:uncharacterized membrane protein